MKKLRKLYSELWNDDKLRIGLKWLLGYSLVSIFVIPLVLTQSWVTIIDYNKTGQVGDTINGIAGPFIAVLVAILTFLAFYVQFKANEQQRTQFNEQMELQKTQFEEQLNLQKEQFNKELSLQKTQSATQDKLVKIERFESKYYELLHLHRANVEELNIDNRVKGRACFEQLFNELRFCYNVVEKEYKKLEGQILDTKIDLLKISYTIFFYGIGKNSEKQFINDLSEHESFLYSKTVKVLENYQRRYIELENHNPNENGYLLKPFDLTPATFYFYPYKGHVEHLSHYYRHLFQTLTFIKEQDPDIFDFNSKYSYAKMLRAQLSSYEQLLIYYNASAWFEEEWREFITDYRIIKNIQHGLADFAKSPLEKYDNEIIRLRARGIEMFEKY